MVHLKRRMPGNYLTTINGDRYTIINMKGDGPSAPRWQGPVPHWEIRKGGRGAYDIGAVTVETMFTLADARALLDDLARGRLVYDEATNSFRPTEAVRP